MIELVAILSSFNRASLLEGALSSLLAALPKQSSAVWVMDAGSNDGSHEIVQRIAAHSSLPVHLIVRENFSFAMGVNVAVKQAMEEYPAARNILLFETDNFVDSGTPIADALSLLAAHPELGAVGFTARKLDGSPAGFGCPRPTLFSFLLGPRLTHHLRLDRPRLQWRTDEAISWAPCEVVYTSPILIRRAAWEATGGFDAKVFPFSDCDLEWAGRLREAGFLQAVIKTSAVMHDNRQTQSLWSAERALHLHKARFELLRREHGARLRAIVPLLALRHLGELAASIFNVGAGATYFAKVRQRWRLLSRSFHSYR